MNRTSYLWIATAAAVLAVGCNTAANNNTNATAVANTASNNTNSTANAASAAVTTGNVAGSPTEVYKAAYAARKNCDVAGLKSVMSKDILKFLTDMGKADNKSLDDSLKDICTRPQAPTAEARNEKIDGDHASLEYLDEDGKWERMDFVKEDGAWKMSIGRGDEPYPAEDAPKKPAKGDNRS